MNKQARNYLIITFFITWSVWFFLAYLISNNVTSVSDSLGLFLYFLGGSASTYVAYIAIKISKHETIKDFHKRVFKFNIPVPYYIFAFLVPVGITMIGQGFYFIFNQTLSFNLSTISFQMIPIFFLSSIIFGGIEEFGWRGIVQDSFTKKQSLLTINLVIGFIWAFWHLPIFFMEGQAHYQTSFLVFIISSIGYSSFMTWLYAKTKSVILPIIFHTMINTIGGSGMFVPMSNQASYLAMSVSMLLLGSWLLFSYQKQLNQ